MSDDVLGTLVEDILLFPAVQEVSVNEYQGEEALELAFPWLTSPIIGIQFSGLMFEFLCEFCKSFAAGFSKSLI